MSDVDKAVGRAYDILGLLDLYRRSTFVVDAEGRLAYAHRSFGPGLSYTPIEQIAAAIELATDAALDGSEAVTDPEEAGAGQ